MAHYKSTLSASKVIGITLLNIELLTKIDVSDSSQREQAVSLKLYRTIRKARLAELSVVLSLLQQASALRRTIPK